LTLKDKNGFLFAMTRLSLLLLLLLQTSITLATEVPDVVKSCLEKNTPKSTSAQAIELRARDRSGYEQVLQANVYWKGSRTIAQEY
jgi:hypothetical protein